MHASPRRHRLVHGWQSYIMVTIIMLAVAVAVGRQGRRGSQQPPTANDVTRWIVDVSPSMYARDTGGSDDRIDSVRASLHQQFDERSLSGSVGIITYSDDARVWLPPSDDYDAISQYVDGIGRSHYRDDGAALDDALTLLDHLTPGSSCVVYSDFAQHSVPRFPPTITHACDYYGIGSTTPTAGRTLGGQMMLSGSRLPQTRREDSTGRAWARRDGGTYAQLAQQP